MGHESKGIPVGKYRVTVEASAKALAKAPMPPPGPPTGNLMGFQNKFQGAYGRERSPFNVEITRPSEVMIEVGNTPKITVQ